MQDTSYADMLAEIGELEASAKKEALCFVDISGVQGGEAQEAAAGYGKMLEVVEEVESKQQKGSAGRQQAQRQAAQEKVERRTAEADAEQASRHESIREEVEGIASRMPAPKPKFGELKIKRLDTKKLVLPNLPISDQIRELEQIMAALKENALDGDQMKVARLELAGLKQHVKDMEEELAREKKSLSALDRSLWDMREQRLDEAVSLMRGGA